MISLLSQSLSSCLYIQLYLTFPSLLRHRESTECCLTFLKFLNKIGSAHVLVFLSKNSDMRGRAGIGINYYHFKRTLGGSLGLYVMQEATVSNILHCVVLKSLQLVLSFNLTVSEEIGTQEHTKYCNPHYACKYQQQQGNNMQCTVSTKSRAKSSLTHRKLMTVFFTSD